MRDMRQIINLVEAALLEARRNPEMNPKISAHEALDKWRGRPNVFVTFVEDLGKWTHKIAGAVGAKKGRDPKPSPHVTGAKFGINPKSEYSTPTGIYAYPLDYVLGLWENGETVPFAYDRPYIWVFELKTDVGVLDLANYTTEQLVTDTRRIAEYVRNHDASYSQNDAAKEAFIQTPAGRFWNIAREGARAVVQQRLYDARYEAWETARDEWRQARASKVHYTSYDDDDEEPEIDDDYEPEFTDEPSLDDIDEDDIKKGAAKEWRRLLLHLGYHAVVDTGPTRLGQGIIHENEPTQAVIFSASVAKPLELVRNIAPRQTPPNDIEMWRNNPRLLLNLMSKGKVTAQHVYELINTHPDVLVEKLPFSALPDEVKKLIRYKIDYYVQRVGSPLPVETFGLNDEEQLILVSRFPWALGRLREVGPSTRAYVIRTMTTSTKGHYLGTFFLQSPAFSLQEKAEIIAGVLSAFAAEGRSTADTEDWFREMVRHAPELATMLEQHAPESSRVSLLIPAFREVGGAKAVMDFINREVSKRPLAWHSVMAMWSSLTHEEREALKRRIKEAPNTVPDWLSDQIQRREIGRY